MEVGSAVGSVSVLELLVENPTNFYVMTGHFIVAQIGEGKFVFCPFCHAAVVSVTAHLAGSKVYPHNKRSSRTICPIYQQRHTCQQPCRRKEHENLSEPLHPPNVHIVSGEGQTGHGRQQRKHGPQQEQLSGKSEEKFAPVSVCLHDYAFFLNRSSFEPFPVFPRDVPCHPENLIRRS